MTCPDFSRDGSNADHWAMDTWFSLPLHLGAGKHAQGNLQGAPGKP